MTASWTRLARLRSVRFRSESKRGSAKRRARYPRDPYVGREGLGGWVIVPLRRAWGGVQTSAHRLEGVLGEHRLDGSAEEATESEREAERWVVVSTLEVADRLVVDSRASARPRREIPRSARRTAIRLWMGVDGRATGVAPLGVASIQ